MTTLSVFWSDYPTLRRITTNLVADHIAALHPDVETPFKDTVDVVKRLLPYHVFQQPKEDLHTIANSGNKGKRKATEEELLLDEIEGDLLLLPILSVLTSSQRRSLQLSAGNGGQRWKIGLRKQEQTLGR